MWEGVEVCGRGKVCGGRGRCVEEGAEVSLGGMVCVCGK